MGKFVVALLFAMLTVAVVVVDAINFSNEFCTITLTQQLFGQGSCADNCICAPKQGHCYPSSFHRVCPETGENTCLPKEGTNGCVSNPNKTSIPMNPGDFTHYPRKLLSRFMF